MKIGQYRKKYIYFHFHLIRLIIDNTRLIKVKITKLKTDINKVDNDELMRNRLKLIKMIPLRSILLIELNKVAFCDAKCNNLTL